ncbi:Hypothetical protein R9X50_00579500 [Acrodontium crateriforme]|uniref:DUF833-domain-containing protein n=1 Tax=Acrodontium crateriforme TaxID=150365 RepID=A0AAQ3RBS7_9PEZI|nr:Hypothetical protein R9X50_00579500 [Acrodontium crateriforme]
MCISILSTAHPRYPFILLSNRDEFLHRSTLAADWWEAPHNNVLGGRDQQRQEQGTWLGVTRQGRIAILTNFREEGADQIARDKSRGGITRSYLTQSPFGEESAEEFAKSLIEGMGISDVGGFTLLFGRLRAAAKTQSTSSRDDAGPEGVFPGLAVISNRTASSKELTRIATRSGETLGLSNSHYGDATWPKVVQGEQLLQEAINLHVSSNGNEEDLIQAGLGILSRNNLPPKREDEDAKTYVRQFRNSILIPPVQGTEGLYGTQKQTIILVSDSGKMTFVERTLFDEDAKPVVAIDSRDKRFAFDIEGWRS